MNTACSCNGDSKPRPRTYFHTAIEPITAAAIKPTKNIFMVAKVPMQVARSFPSDTLLMWAASNPRILRTENKDIKGDLKIIKILHMFN